MNNMNNMNNMNKTDRKTLIFIFKVERGLAVFMILPNKHAVVYDLGSSNEFSPAEYVGNKLIKYIVEVDQLLVSHPHKDHYSDAQAYMAMLNKNDKKPTLITMPHFRNKEEGLSEQRFSKTSDEDMKLYKSIYGERKPPLLAISYPDKVMDTLKGMNIEVALYYMRPPMITKLLEYDDQHYANGTSLCFYYRHNNNAILIPGDVTPEVFDKIIKGHDSVRRAFSILSSSEEDGIEIVSSNGQTDSSSVKRPLPALSSLISDDSVSTVYVTPHHGLESCYCKLFHDTCTPILNIISEGRGTRGDTPSQYSTNSVGMEIHKFLQGNDEVQTETRKMVSTRNDGHILIVFGGGDKDLQVYTSHDLDNLMEIAEPYIL